MTNLITKIGKAPLHKKGKASPFKRRNTFAYKTQHLCIFYAIPMHILCKADNQEKGKGLKSQKIAVEAIPTQGLIEISTLHKKDRHIDNKIIIRDNCIKIILKDNL